MTARSTFFLAFVVVAATTMGCASKPRVRAAAPPPPKVEAKAEPAPAPEPVKIAYIDISDRIQFEPGRAVILEPSKKILDEVVKAMAEHPDLELVEIEGHTDWVGRETQNLDLSARRAEAVRAHLISKGVSADRLAAKGYGEMKPIADNTTREGRETNRRVTFRVLRQAGVSSSTTETVATSTGTPSAS
jgi:outer membrane protein OmpA-like peptidoglycan-associated protein